MIAQVERRLFVAVVYIQEFPIRDTAGLDDEAGVFRILEVVWETCEPAERFLAESVQPLIEQGPQAFPNPDHFEQPRGTASTSYATPCGKARLSVLLAA